MVFIPNWDIFYEQAVELFKAAPLRTRYTMKYKHAEGKFVVKVTDDRVVRGAAWGAGRRAGVSGVRHVLGVASPAPRPALARCRDSPCRVSML